MTSDPGLSNIMNDHNLNHGQVWRQFAKWKSAKYDFASTVLTSTSDEIQDNIEQMLSTTVEELVVETLEDVIAAPQRVQNNSNSHGEENRRMLDFLKYCTMPCQSIYI